MDWLVYPSLAADANLIKQQGNGGLRSGERFGQHYLANNDGDAGIAAKSAVSSCRRCSALALAGMLLLGRSAKAGRVLISPLQRRQ